MSDNNHQTVEDEHIDSATPTPSPLDKVRQHQAELQQGLQQQSEDVEERLQDDHAEVIGEGIPSDRKHHPQRTQF